ncbi:MAG: hypothetical protein K2Y40_12885 [Reyranella sp.]|nr:hypothetical protein [Reyranella sp.]
MAGEGESGVGHEQALLAFADAAVGATEQLAEARAAVLRDLGEAALLDAAAVIAGFDAITRVADGTGIPLVEAMAEATAAWRELVSL